MTKSVGQPVNRVDGSLKVCGKALYTNDQQVPNPAYAVLVTSTVARGRITSIETVAAARVPGVLVVLTHKSGLRLAKDPKEVSPSSPADRVLQLLQDDRVLYAGQPIAIVVAETLEAAREAASRVTVHYAEERPSIRIDDSISSAYVPQKAGGGGDPGASNRGDFDAEYPKSAQQLKQVYSTPFHTHNPMEPHATTAVWNGPDRLTLFDASQGIFGDRKRMADLLGLKPENVRVVSLFIGGGFGSKGPTWSHNVLCALAARHVQRPVKLALERPQMFGPIGCRSETRQTISIGAEHDGAIRAMENITYSHTSTFDEFTETATLPTRMLYSCPNNRTVQNLVRSDIGTPSYTRAPGECPGTFALEVAMDELAYKLGMDPLALRLKNYADRDENKNLPWSSKRLSDCYRMGADRFGWAKRKMEPRSTRDGHRLVGWGMATSVYPARRSPSSAFARLNPDGTVLVEAGSQELGGGTYTIMTQIAADQLGVPARAVTFLLGDTKFPETPVSGGSQTAASCGAAVYQATTALRQKIVDLAQIPAAEASQMRIEGGTISAGSVSISVRDLLARTGHPYLEAIAKTNDQTKQYSPFSFGAQFAEVRVDVDLGQLEVSRMTGVFAAGRILNAKTARSQFIGGMVWGVSMALHEDTMYDIRLGRIVNNNLAEYHVPTNMDIPAIDVAWVDEVDDKVSPMGAKGIGEIGITGAAAAISNAVYHATGKRIRDLPITPDKLI